MMNATVEKNPKVLEERKIRHISLRQNISNSCVCTNILGIGTDLDRGPYNIAVLKIKKGLRN